MTRPRITPCLWFDGRAEEAMEFYRAVFPDTETVSIARREDGSVLTATFRLQGQELMALNGGPHFTFTPAISLFVRCEDQAEVDALWDQLSAGGAVQQCGWLRDRFGLSWQIVPAALGAMLQDPDKARSARVMRAMMGMIKLDIAALEAAFRGDG